MPIRGSSPACQIVWSMAAGVLASMRVRSCWFATSQTLVIHFRCSCPSEVLPLHAFHGHTLHCDCEDSQLWRLKVMAHQQQGHKSLRNACDRTSRVRLSSVIHALAFFGWGFLLEGVRARAIFGCGLMVVAMLLVAVCSPQVAPNTLKNKCILSMCLCEHR